LIDETKEYSSQYGGSVGTIVLGETIKALKGQVQRLPFYGSLASRRRRFEVSLQSWFTPEFRATLPDREYEPYVPGLAHRLLESVTVSPLPLYLRQEDRNSMAHSVEARLPFLDHRLVALAFNVTEDWKVKGKLGKVLLREAMRGRIPEIVRARVDKMGFPTPSTTWFRDDLYGPTRDVFASRDFAELGLFEPRAAQALLERHKRREVDASADLFGLVQFTKWAALAKRRLATPP
jgi:asparagine synthase (glutamine-hydrolysing)